MHLYAQFTPPACKQKLYVLYTLYEFIWYINTLYILTYCCLCSSTYIRFLDINFSLSSVRNYHKRQYRSIFLFRKDVSKQGEHLHRTCVFVHWTCSHVIWDRKDLEMETFVVPVPNLEDSVMSLRTSLGDGDWNKNDFHVKKGNALIRVKENRNHAGTNRKMYEHAIEQGEVHIFTEKMWWLWWDGRKDFERYLKLRHQRTGKDFVHRCLFALFQNRGQYRAQHADRTTFAWRRFWDACTSLYKYIHTFSVFDRFAEVIL